jgi:hypothetical protein
VNGNLTEILYVNGKKEIFTYDANNMLISVKYYDTDGTTLIGTNTYTYDANGVLITIGES